jgi:hypothetical protein
MKRLTTVTKLLVFFVLIGSCQKKLQEQSSPSSIWVAPKEPKYDIILLMGQSNTLAGSGYDPAKDYPDPRVMELGRFGTLDTTIIMATEPLQNFTPEPNCIGFALTFAKLYAEKKLQPGRQLLIIPCGANSSGFLNGHWNRGNDLYKDAIMRTNWVLHNYSDSRLISILWHQGEADVTFGAAGYRGALESMIKALHSDIKADKADSIPFILGGMVPYWVKRHPEFGKIDSILRTEPGRLPVAGFADPELPFVIKKPVDTVNAIHFDANGQREMGKRYFAEYLRLTK